jgi:hypothetical protein
VPFRDGADTPQAVGHGVIDFDDDEEQNTAPATPEILIALRMTQLGNQLKSRAGAKNVSNTL